MCIRDRSSAAPEPPDGDLARRGGVTIGGGWKIEPGNHMEEDVRKDIGEEAGRGGVKPGGSSEEHSREDGAKATKNGKVWKPGTREKGAGGGQGLRVQQDEEYGEDHPSKIDGAGGGKPGHTDEEELQFEI